MLSIKPMHILPAAVLMILVAACSKTPRGILDQEDMAMLMADVYCGESVIDFNMSHYSNDSMKKVVKQSVLMAHNIEPEQFDSSIAWYGRHIEDYIKVCDRAVEILEARAVDIPDDPHGNNRILVAGDSAQVWPLQQYYHISAATPSKYVVFNLTSDDNWEPGDEYTLSFKSINMRTPIKSLLAVDYEDGGTQYSRSSLDADGWEKTVIKLDTTRVANAVYGYIQFNPQTNEDIYVDSVSLVRTRVNLLNYRSRRSQASFGRGNAKL